MFDGYSGATRVIFIVGDPIAQVKSPAGVTAQLRQRGVNAIVVPAHVVPADLAGWTAAVARMRNVDGILVTVPHKFDALPLCVELTPRAASIGAVNILRRASAEPGAGWLGDMCDGEGHVNALHQAGCNPAGRRALLVGAGGAGSAIAHALVDAGVAALAVHDPDAARLSALLGKLARYAAATGKAPALLAGSADPAGYGLVVNATPLGMRAGDPLPVAVQRLDAATFVSDVVTVPAVPPLIAQARARGCGTMTGTGMFDGVRECIVDFYMAPSAASRFAASTSELT